MMLSPHRCRFDLGVEGIGSPQHGGTWGGRVMGSPGIITRREVLLGTFHCCVRGVMKVVLRVSDF